MPHTCTCPLWHQIAPCMGTYATWYIYRTPAPVHSGIRSLHVWVHMLHGTYAAHLRLSTLASDHSMYGYICYMVHMPHTCACPLWHQITTCIGWFAVVQAGRSLGCRNFGCRHTFLNSPGANRARRPHDTVFHHLRPARAPFDEVAQLRRQRRHVAYLALSFILPLQHPPLTLHSPSGAPAL